MHTKWNLVLGLLLSISFLSAQEITVSDDVPLKNSTRYEIFGISNRVLLLQERPSEIEVKGFSSNLREQWEKKLELDKRLPKLVGVTNSRTHFTLVYYYRRKGDIILKAHKYDAAANLKDSVEIHNYGKLFFTPNFEVAVSKDKSKMLIYHVERYKNIKAFVYDADSMKVVSGQTIVPEEKDFNFDFFDALVSNTGNFALIIGRSNFRSSRKDHIYEMYEYNRKQEKVNPFKINLGDSLTFSTKFAYDALNDNLVAGGMYSVKNLAFADGYFFISIPSENPKNHKITYHEFDAEFISSLLGKEKENHKGIREAAVQDIVLRRDGGILIVNERVRQFERRSVGPTGRLYYDPTRRFLVDYYHEDIFVISIHPDGSPHWKTILPKKQFSQDDIGIFSSYFLFKSRASIKFIFNDEIKNANTISEYKLMGDGSFERESLLNTANLDLKLRFRDAIQVGSNEFIIPSQRKNRVKLVFIKY